jgi:hypothetical protein
MSSTEQFTEASGGALSFGQAVIQAGATLFGVLSTLSALLPFLVAGVAITAFMILGSTYGDKWAEDAEHALRADIYPIWLEDVKDLFSLARQLFNNLICWWDAFTWWFVGLLRQVLFPTARECGLRPILTKAAVFIRVFVVDYVVVIISGQFRTQLADFSRISPAGIDLFQSWINLYTCACSDLGDVLRTTPIVSPLLVFPPTWPLVLFSQQWTDPQTWCAIENVANTGIALLQQLFQLAVQILNVLAGNTGPNFVFLRPDLRKAADILCEAVRCAARSVENANQLWWDRYVPFDFKWEGFLVAVDVFGCIVTKTTAWIALVLVNIDQAVQYPSNPWWETVSKPEVIILINMWAQPSDWAPIRIPYAPLTSPVRYTMTNYFLNQQEESTPWGAPNPLFQRPRLTEGLCTMVTRAICDQNDQQMGCFSNIAQNLLMGFDFCCLVRTAGTTLADVASALFEFTLHFAKGPDDFFLTVDGQPFTTVVRRDLIAFVRCAFAAFGLIPNFGFALRDLLTGIIAYIISMADFFIRVLVGLATLPYYLLSLTDVTNFVQTPNVALEFFVAIQDELIANTPSSVRNSLCVLANNALPIPPIPCSQCVVGGFIPPSTSKRDYRFFDDAGNPLNTPHSLMREAWGLPPPEENEASYHITPLIYYGANHTRNPIELYNLLYIHVSELDPKYYPHLPWKGLRDVDSFMDAKKAKMMKTWRSRQQCNQRAQELRQMELHEPKRFRYMTKHGAFANETCTQTKDIPLVVPFKERYSNGGGKEMRLTSLPTKPPVIGCSPTPQCFDLCCILRTLLTLLVHLVSMGARFFNGLIQGSAFANGTLQNFPYFTGELATIGKPTFESDTVKLILLAFQPIQCVCEVLNLIIPVSPRAFSAGRPDLCCFVQKTAELLSCTYQVLNNAINALAMGSSTNWAYFRMGLFVRDVETLLDLALEVVTCLCVLVRAVFPLDFIPGYAQATDFDPCCGVEVLLQFAIEVTRFILQIVISLVTITINPDSFCYWRLDVTNAHQCGGKLDNIGVVKQWDVLNQVLLPKHTLGNTGAFVPLPNGGLTWVSDDNPTSSGGACYNACGIDNGANGIVPCICQILDTLIPFRRFPDRKVNCSMDPDLKNCQELDLCCFFSKVAFFIMDFNFFAGRVVVGLWQSWDSGLPEFAVNYFWCVEPQKVPCPLVQNPRPDPCQAMIDHPPIPQCAGNYPVMDPNTMMPVTRCGEFTCAKTNIIIADLADPNQGLLAKCTCEVLGLLDTLVALIFNLLSTLPGLEYATWSCCLCGGYNPQTNQCSRRTLNFCQAGQIFTPLSNPGETGGSGVLPAASYIVGAVTTAAFRLMRQIPFSCYWHPSLAYGSPVPTNIAQTWIFSFGGPTADALCIAVGNMQCFANSLFFLPQRCLANGEKFLGGTVRWAAELVFRIVGFIEAFINTLIALPWSCIGGNCGPSAGYTQPPVKGINSRRLGEMLVILLSWPFDALIGDAAVACTTICPSTFAVPRPDSGLEYAPFFGCQAGALSCSCGCWNDSPNYANRRGRVNNIPPYQWMPSTDPNGVCKDMSPQAIQSGITRHVGERFGRTDGCCVLTNPLLTNLPESMPVCQSPDDSDLYFGANSDFAGVITYDPIGYPGSCAYLGACRPDALPSCANDPMTPLNLSINYRGALDGMVMAFLKYMRCLLDYTLTCQRAGAPCDPGLQFGIIFYPAILIFSLIWQLLGGLIRFIVAIVIFFFTLFTPPEGGPCQCWGGTYVDGYGDDSTSYYTIGNQWFFGGFCYPCRTPNVDCGKIYMNLPGTALGTINYFVLPCKPYCPVFHKFYNPGLSTADALNMCLAAYEEFSPKLHTTFSAMEICTGRIMVPHTVYEFRPDYTDAPQATCTLNPCVPTQNVPNSCFTSIEQNAPFFTPRGLCSPFNGANCGNTPGSYYVPIDMCADPTCQDPATPALLSNGFYIGMWPDGCGYNAWASSLPDNPLVQCGVLQIVSAFLDVFRAFVAIFDTPFFITPNESRRRSSSPGEEGNETFVSISSATAAFSTIQKVIQLATKENRTRFEKSSTSSRLREPRQAWNRRMKGRFSGLLSGPSIEDPERPNFAESLSSALFAYDMSDCYDDPVLCACRNLDMHSHCYLDANGTLVFPGRKRQHMTTSELNTMLSQEMFTGTTVCDHVISSHAGQDWSTEVTMNQKHPWVNCLDKYVQGSRIATLTDGVVPSDILYNGQAPITFVHNLFNSAKRAVRADSSARIKARMAEGTQRNMTRILEDFEHKFPKWHEQLRNRTLFANEFVQKEYGITPDHLMFDAIVKADLMAFKYQSGYYRFMIHEASKVVTSGDLGALIPTKEEALQEVRHSFDDLRKIFWSQRFTDITVASYHAARKVGDAAWDVYEEGVRKWASRQWTTFDSHAKRRGDPEQPERVRLLKESIQASPLWRMWFASNNNNSTTEEEEEEPPRTSLFGPFIEHMGRVFAHYRSKEGVQNSVAFWNLDIHFWSAKDILTRRWQNPKWTPQKLEAWDQLHRLVMRVQHWIWPDSLTEEQQKRFLYGGNCVLIDRTVNLTMQAVDYCANEYVVNVRDVADDLFRSITDHSAHKEHYYHGWRQRQHFNYELMPLSLKQNDTLAWRRPRLNVTSAAAHYHARWKARELHKQVDRRAYRRAVVQERHGPAGMDFYDQLLLWMENLFQLTFTAEADTWFDAVREWFLNPNINVESYPDVGFRYWVRFPFVCNFPQSLNCSIGVGLEMGLLYTLITMLVVVVIGAYVFSPITLPFQFLTYPLAFVIILGAWAYHWSPICAFPPPFVGIPMCLADDIYAFLNKWITNCYVPLVLPAYMVAGETCPADPTQYIDVLSCAQIGIRDGFQNWLYLGHWFFGTAFSDTFLQVSSAVFSAFLPGVHTYFARTLEAFMSAGATDQERLTFCFWATSPAMVTPLLVGVLLIGVGVAVVLAAVALLEGLVRLYMASPASVVVKGTENNVWYEEEPLGSDTDNQAASSSSSSSSNENAPAVAAAVAAAAPIGARGSWFTNWMHGGPPPPPSRSSKAWEKKNQ